MCGIAGCVGLPGAQAAAAAMVGAMAHRGPDNRSLWAEGDVALGHARLAIVDLSPLGNQPMVNEDGGIVLVGNGEVYNSPELRLRLEAQGHVFRSHSDNETLLHLYEQGMLDGNADWPRDINGMVAFGLWDRTRRRLLLGRDRLGIKPLYFCEMGSGLIFASEIKGLLAHPLARARIDAQGLREYLAFENTFGDRTLFAGVRMVEPGQTILFADGRLAARRYWELAFCDDAPLSFGEACEAFLSTAAASVQRHLMADVEIATYLSGGFDSTTVATLALEHLGTGVLTFTGSFDVPGWYDETPGALAVAERIGSRHTTVRMDAGHFAETFDDLVYHLDEPRMGFGSFSQYVVAREAARHVKVILTGHGGDELFAGYPVFKFLRLAQAFKSFSLAGLARLARVKPAEWPHVVYFLGRDMLGDGPRDYLPVITSGRRLEAMLLPETARLLRGIDPREGLRRTVGEEPDAYRRLTRTYLQTYLPGLFVVEDKISMAHSLESRTPLCDNAMLDLGLRMPFDVKLTDDTLKAVPKAAMQARLPEILYRLPKRGFPTPLRVWFRKELRDWAHHRLHAADSPLHTLFGARAVADAWSGFCTGWQRHVRPLDDLLVHRIWQLLCIDSWMRRFGLDGKSLA